MEFEFLVNNRLYTVSLEKRESQYRVSDGEGSYEADIQQISPHCISIFAKGQTCLVYFAREKESLHVCLDGHHFMVQESLRAGESIQSDSDRSPEEMLIVKSPMPGKVIKIDVFEGDQVRKNQTLAVVEAMKMENEIKSSIEGSVKKIFVSTGDLVDVDKPLIELERRE